MTTSKTVWTAAALGVLGVVDANNHVLTGVIAPILGASTTGVVMSVMSAVFLVLRAVTTQPLSERK